MEFLFLILVILFVVANRGKKSARAQNNGKPPASTAKSPAQRVKSAQAEEALERARQRARRRLEQQAAAEAAPIRPRVMPGVGVAVPAEGEALLEDADCLGGSMPHTHDEGQSILEDADCAGGSLVHTHTQGVSRAAQSRRLADLDRDREEAAADDVLIPTAIDARALRRAVVMAEVLGKPKGMKGF